MDAIRLLRTRIPESCFSDSVYMDRSFILERFKKIMYLVAAFRRQNLLQRFHFRSRVLVVLYMLEKERLVSISVQSTLPRVHA